MIRCSLFLLSSNSCVYRSVLFCFVCFVESSVVVVVSVDVGFVLLSLGQYV